MRTRLHLIGPSLPRTSLHWHTARDPVLEIPSNGMQYELAFPVQHWPVEQAEVFSNFLSPVHSRACRNPSSLNALVIAITCLSLDRIIRESAELVLNLRSLSDEVEQASRRGLGAHSCVTCIDFETRIRHIIMCHSWQLCDADYVSKCHLAVWENEGTWSIRQQRRRTRAQLLFCFLKVSGMLRLRMRSTASG